MGLTLITGSNAELLTLDQIKTHLRIEEGVDDALLGAFRASAHEWAEDYTERQFLTATYDLTLDGFPGGGKAIYLPKPPLQSVTSINYIDHAGAEQTWDAADYIVDTTGQVGRITPAWLETYPVTREIPNAVTVRFVAGYGGANDIPRPILVAMLSLIAHWYEHREAVVVSTSGNAVNEVPMTFKNILRSYQVLEF